MCKIRHAPRCCEDLGVCHFLAVFIDSYKAIESRVLQGHTFGKLIQEPDCTTS